jgi:predicted ATPase
MLATIRNRNFLRGAHRLLVAAAAFVLISCATKEPPPLITDPSAKKETALPWNEQQKWEREGEAAALNQQRR